MEYFDVKRNSNFTFSISTNAITREGGCQIWTESFYQSSKTLREDLLVLYLLAVAGEGTIYPFPFLVLTGSSNN